MQFENMKELREEIDLLDNELIILFSKRFKFIENAALIKSDINDIRDITLSANWMADSKNKQDVLAFSSIKRNKINIFDYFFPQ